MPRPLAWAYRAGADGDWDAALRIARRDGPVGESVMEWIRLRAGEGDADEVLAFLDAHPDWPGLALLRKNSEEVFEDAPPSEVARFFAGQPPQTAKGALIQARAMKVLGLQERSDKALIEAWESLPMDADTQAAFWAMGAKVLAPHNAERLRALFWDGNQGSINRMMPLLSSADAALARARSSGDRAAIAALPASERKDPTLAYARFQALVKAGKTDDAKALMDAQSRVSGGLGQPEAWANLRRVYAREEMRRDNPSLAFSLAAHNQLSSGTEYADLEWLAGFIALRQLKKPDVALRHFQNLLAGVQTPISLGRAYYWMGRAYAAMGKHDMAMAAWQQGGQYQTSYYGLLAAEAAGMPFDMSLAGKGPLPDWKVPAITGSRLREAGELLVSAGHPYWSEMFMMQLADSLPDKDLPLMGAMFEAQGDPHLQVRLGKHAADEGIILPRDYYALHPLRKMKLPVPTELALSIARRESEFDPDVVSSAGARGLMQLMPGTADDMADALDIPTADHRELMDRWQHNVRLGSAYLAQLAVRFDGNPVLMSVAYNAGPRRASQWIDLFGDPRDRNVDVVDWVEFIPYRETRNYVQRVTESLPVYRARLGKTPLPKPFSQELKGSALLALPLSPERK